MLADVVDGAFISKLDNGNIVAEVFKPAGNIAFFLGGKGTVVDAEGGAHKTFVLFLLGVIFQITLGFVVAVHFFFQHIADHFFKVAEVGFVLIDTVHQHQHEILHGQIIVGIEGTEGFPFRGGERSAQHGLRFLNEVGYIGIIDTEQLHLLIGHAAAGADSADLRLRQEGQLFAFFLLEVLMRGQKPLFAPIIQGFFHIGRRIAQQSRQT